MQGAHCSAQLLRDDAQDVRRQHSELEAPLGRRAAAGQGMIHGARCSGALRQTCKRGPNRVEAIRRCMGFKCSVARALPSD